MFGFIDFIGKECMQMWKKVCAGLLGCSMAASVSLGAAFAAPEQADAPKNVQAEVPKIPGGVNTGNVVSAPAVQQPAVQPPATQQPVTQPPATTQPPAAQQPATQQPATQQPKAETPAAKTSQEKKIVINIASRSLALYQGTEKIRLYPLGLGKPYTPTPTGYYKISSKDVNPTWSDPSDPSVVIPSGESNPLGYRWMLLYGNYGIHGTNRPDSIGHYVSNGCVRMKESDVEALFDLVEVGTPVEITYNRIVVEKAPDDTVVYYIYPDGYDCQPVDVALVNRWLEGYGVSAFVSDEAIQQKIAASDGEPTFIGKVYNTFVNGNKLVGKTVVVDNVTYLPAVDVAQAVKLDLQWKQDAGTLVTPYGQAKGYNKKNVLYCNAADAATLFRLKGTLESTKSYVLKSEKPVAPAAVPANPGTAATAPAAVPANPGTAAAAPAAVPANPGTAAAASPAQKDAELSVVHEDKPVLIYEKQDLAKEAIR